jgi:hypothetical protein
VLGRQGFAIFRKRRARGLMATNPVRQKNHQSQVEETRKR